MYIVIPLVKSEVPPAEVVRRAYEESRNPLLLLGVIQPGVPGRRETRPLEVVNSAAIQAAQLELRNAAFAAGLPPSAFRSITSLHPSVPQAIVEEAKAANAEAIVIGSTARRGIARFLPVGKDVAQELRKMTDIPVKVVQPDGAISNG